MIYKSIGENQVSFEKGTLYEAHEEYDKEMGEHYSIKDESGEWYDYSKTFFEKNFEKQEIEKEAV